MLCCYTLQGEAFFIKYKKNFKKDKIRSSQIRMSKVSDKTAVERTCVGVELHLRRLLRSIVSKKCVQMVSIEGCFPYVAPDCKIKYHFRSD